MEISSIQSLNKKARKFLLEHCISKRAAEIIAHGFTGHINSNYYENASLIRSEGKWRVFGSYPVEYVLGLGGEIDSFNMTKNTIL